MTCEEGGSQSEQVSSPSLNCRALQSSEMSTTPRALLPGTHRPQEAQGEEPEERPLAHQPGLWEIPGCKFMFNQLINDFGS